MTRRGKRLSNPLLFLRVMFRGSAPQRVAVGIGLVAVGLGLSVTAYRVFEHWQWAIVVLLGWFVCEMGVRDFRRSAKKKP